MTHKNTLKPYLRLGEFIAGTRPGKGAWRWKRAVQPMLKSTTHPAVSAREGCEGVMRGGTELPS